MKNKILLQMYLSALVTTLIILTVLTQTFSVIQGVGPSMQPTMSERNLTIGFKLADEFTVGDIVTFDAGGWNLDKHMTKRIAGVAGDTVVIDGVNLYINNALVDDSLVAPGYAHQEYTLAEDELFVLGDNRSMSLDSRAKGPIKTSDILSEVLFWIDY